MVVLVGRVKGTSKIWLGVSIGVTVTSITGTRSKASVTTIAISITSIGNRDIVAAWGPYFQYECYEYWVPCYEYEIYEYWVSCYEY